MLFEEALGDEVTLSATVDGDGAVIAVYLEQRLTRDSVDVEERAAAGRGVRPGRPEVEGTDESSEQSRWPVMEYADGGWRS